MSFLLRRARLRDIAGEKKIKRVIAQLLLLRYGKILLQRIRPAEITA